MLRVALVTRRFWPLVGGTERVMATLAEELAQLEAKPLVLTAQWDSHWPAEINHAGTPVQRLPQPQVRGWGTLRYLWSLSSWLKAHRDELDAVIVSGLEYEAYTAVTALAGSSVPVILRAETAGPAGDCQWQRESRFGKRIKRRCQQAAAIVAASDAVSAELLAAEYSSDRVQCIPNGVPIPEPRTSQRREAARAILGEANPDMKVSDDTPVALYVGRLSAEKGLHDLVRAWRRIINAWPEARLWLVGEGPDRDDLYDRLRDHELKYHVAMPGAFDDVTELLYAADVFVLPSYEEGTTLSLLEAMAAALPVVASDIPGHERLATHREHALLAPIKNPVALAESIAEVLTLSDEAAARAERARQHVMDNYSAKQMAQRHLELIQGLVAGGASREADV
jgi:glycosyltransferase involved in cell wall biosynthesis